MPKPGPPVVSICTVRARPSAFGLLQVMGAAFGIGGAAGPWLTFGAAGAGAACGAAAGCGAATAGRGEGPVATWVEGALLGAAVGAPTSLTTARGAAGRAGSDGAAAVVDFSPVSIGQMLAEIAF